MELHPAEIVLLLFAAIGPLKVTIVFATLTAKAPPEFVRTVALRSVIIATIVCILFALSGEAILRLFKVSIPAFQIAGGILVLIFSIDMVTGGKQDSHEDGAGPDKKNAELSLDIATYPLAIPLMASVSGLVAIVSVVSQRDDLWAMLFLTGVITSIMVINYLCLRSCQTIVRIVGPTILQVVGKMMGVIMAALAVELVLMGLVSLKIVAKPG